MSTIEMNVFEVPEFFWVKYGNGIPVEIRTADIRNVIELVRAVKAELPTKLGNFDVSQLTVRLPVGITRADSGLTEECLMYERPDLTLHPSCPVSALDNLVTSKHQLVIEVITPSDEEVGRYHTSSSY